MAGDWIKVQCDLGDKPEVHYIASLTQLDHDAVIGKLFRVWSWFDRQTTDGNADNVTLALLDCITSHAGFGEAMQFAGWIEQRGKTLVMINFERHNGESAKKRALTAQRLKRFRNAESVTLALPEKRREEKSKDLKPLAASGEPLLAGGNGSSVAYIPLADKTDWGVTPEYLAELETAYPAVDGPATLKEIRAWCISNPTKCKTRRGIMRFVNRWFERTQNA